MEMLNKQEQGEQLTAPTCNGCHAPPPTVIHVGFHPLSPHPSQVLGEFSIPEPPPGLSYPLLPLLGY